MKKELGYGSAKPGGYAYLPIVTDDEGKPAVKPDVFIDDKIYSEAEMVSLFQVSNPGRKTREEMDFFPALTRQNADGYFIMFDRANTLGGEPLAIGRVGWKYLPEHKLYLTTGIKVIEMYRELGLSRSLWQKRDSAVFKNTPAIGMASNFSESWLKLIQSEGWKVDPPVESLPESIQDEVRETIAGDKPRRLISKNIDMAMKKAWNILKSPYRMKNPNFPKRQSDYFQGDVPQFEEKVVDYLYQGAQEGSSSEYWSTNIYEAMPYALFGSGGSHEDPHFRLSGKPIINRARKTEDEKNVYYDFNETTAMTGREHTRLGGTSEEDPMQYQTMPDDIFDRHYRVFKTAILRNNPLITQQAYMFLEQFVLNNMEQTMKHVNYEANEDQITRAIKGVKRLERNLVNRDIDGSVNMFVGNAIGMNINDPNFLGLILIQLRLLEMKYKIG